MKRGKLNQTQSIHDSLILHGDWAMMSLGEPQKIFLWDQGGTYQDCAFPNPIYGHFLGGQELKGKNIRDVLESQAMTQLLEAMIQTTKSGRPVRVNLFLFGALSAYKTVVRLFPFSDQIMGLINDCPVPKTSDTPASVRLSTPGRIHESKKTFITYTNREREICALLCEGKSNPRIAHQLQVSERTVRFHLENLFRKCQVSSRLQLAQYTSDLLQL